MIDIKIDFETMKPVIINGDFVTVTGDECILQCLKIHLKMWLEDWFLNAEEGVDFLGTVMEKPYNLSKIESEYKRVILSTQGIKKIISYNQTITNQGKDGDLLTITFTALTENNTVISDTQEIKL